MAISETDLRLLKSERMTDYEDGGGLMTSNEVVDGEVNNLFNDISQLDRTYGRVSLRKAYAAVHTANTDTYLGAHIILTDPPDDPKVNVTLFSTESWTDERTASRNRIESYSIEGPEVAWILYGTHVVGQKMLSLFSRPNATSMIAPSSAETPEIGDVMVLSIEKTGYAELQQYVRITKITSRTLETFTDGNGPFYKDVLILEISSALRYEFPGTNPSRLTLQRNAAESSPTVFKRTSVADAAEYYGVKKVLASVPINTSEIEIGTPYGALVPSAQSETALIDVPANMVRPNYVPSGAAASLTASLSLSGTVSPEYAARLFMSRGIVPGTLTLTIGGTGYRDDSNGNIVLTNGTAGTYGGSVDYASGAVTITKSSSWTATVSASATPGVVIYNNAGTAFIRVTINNRAFNYVNTLLPTPAPGSLIVDYKALDKWYRLYDDGTGKLKGIVDGIGSGTVNYATGSVAVTLAAMPDLNSEVIFAWSTPSDYKVENASIGANMIPLPDYEIILAADIAGAYKLNYASIVINWTHDGVVKQATGTIQGLLSGDATGTISPLMKKDETGKYVFDTTTDGKRQWKVNIRPNILPASGTTFTAAYNTITSLNDFATNCPYTGTAATITLPIVEPIKPGSVSFGLPLSGTLTPNLLTMASVPHQAFIHVKDNGTGGLTCDYHGFYGVATNEGLTRFVSVKYTATQQDLGGGVTLAGTIDYDTGIITLDPRVSIAYNAVKGTEKIGTDENTITVPLYEVKTALFTPTNPFSVLVSHTQVSASPTGLPSVTKTLTEFSFDVTPYTTNTILAGSLSFQFGDDTIVDRNGLLYRNHSKSTDAASQCGSVDYETGIATLVNWAGGNNAVNVKSCVVEQVPRLVVGVVGRAPSAPLATGQFQLVCTAYDGTSIVASADNNGVVSHEWVRGSIDWDSGVFKISFGKYVLDSSLSPEVKANSGWYSASGVNAQGYIWYPLLVKPETITFNAVLVSYIPLDADILGLETVRLPLDGKVPVFRIGNVVVIHNTQTLELPNPVVAGQTYNLGRTLLSYAKVFDANGDIVPTTKYTTDLDAGTITMSDPLDLTGYVLPLKVEHRIEDMSLVTDVQITGQVKLMKPVRHAYPANTTFLSSALVIGDMQARVTYIFDQQTWNSSWADAVVGSASNASYNDVLYPIETTNVGAIQERWAIVFTGATTFNCYGEYSGLVATGNTGLDFAPVNPVTNQPYFTINKLGWGSGWASGNVLRFNTVAANYPMWLARTTLQSDPQVYSDNFKLQIRGDAN